MRKHKLALCVGLAIATTAMPALAHTSDSDGKSASADSAAADQTTPATPPAAAPAAAPAAPATTFSTTSITSPSASKTITDASLGTSVIGRFFRYQAAEWNEAASPLATDPNAPPGRRPYFPPQPVTTPPYPYTEWPYGGATSLGVNRPASVDSPLMVAIADTGLGKALSAAHIQTYGWFDIGGNLSTSTVQGGNQPAAYAYDPNTVLLNQIALYLERTPDTVQEDHVDWGFRVGGVYGSDYHYTASRGFLVDRGLYQKNKVNGLDIPMIWGELYIPKIAKGLLIRVGRYISVPDIEAQLAPNNYMYTHSITYTYDNYTNEGIALTLAVTKNLFLTGAIAAGTDSALWNAHQTITNYDPNALFPNSTFKRDPGSKPAFTACARYQSSSARDNVYLCADAINSGTWGYNNLQWFGGTFYHKFTDRFHVAFEAYTLFQRNVLNLNYVPTAASIAAGQGGQTGENIWLNGGTPFSPSFNGGLSNNGYYPFNGPSAAQCNNTNRIACTARSATELSYWNYEFNPLNNISFREEFYNDEEGQLTGYKTRYYSVGFGYQHWFGPQIEVRPEIVYYHSLDTNAFNINNFTGDNSQAKNHLLLLSGDIIIHW